MRLGSSLYHARKKSGLSQENVAEKLGVSRQTISKWETGETLPDIRQSKGLAMLYHVTLDELIEYDFDGCQGRRRQGIHPGSERRQAALGPGLCRLHGTGIPPSAGNAVLLRAYVAGG